MYQIIFILSEVKFFRFEFYEDNEVFTCWFSQKLSLVPTSENQSIASEQTLTIGLHSHDLLKFGRCLGVELDLFILFPKFRSALENLTNTFKNVLEGISF